MRRARRCRPQARRAAPSQVSPGSRPAKAGVRRRPLHAIPRRIRPTCRANDAARRPPAPAGRSAAAACRFPGATRHALKPARHSRSPGPGAPRRGAVNPPSTSGRRCCRTLMVHATLGLRAPQDPWAGPSPPVAWTTRGAAPVMNRPPPVATSSGAAREDDLRACPRSRPVSPAASRRRPCTRFERGRVAPSHRRGRPEAESRRRFGPSSCIAPALAA